MARRNIKNCPSFDTGKTDWVRQCNFDFTQEFYKKFQDFMYKNPGKTAKELCEIITFYDFTEESIEVAFKMFNTWKNSFYGVCGPFIYKNNRWFPVYSKKYTDTVLLAEENSKLRSRIDELEAKLKEMDSPGSS